MYIDVCIFFEVEDRIASVTCERLPQQCDCYVYIIVANICLETTINNTVKKRKTSVKNSFCLEIIRTQYKQIRMDQPLCPLRSISVHAVHLHKQVITFRLELLTTSIRQLQIRVKAIRH